MPNNFYRLLRVLEIVQSSGSTLAALDIDESAPLDFDFRCFFLHRPRADLYRRIDLRCEQMLQSGLLQARDLECRCTKTTVQGGIARRRSTDGVHVAEGLGHACIQDVSCCKLPLMVGFSTSGTCTPNVSSLMRLGVCYILNNIPCALYPRLWLRRRRARSSSWIGASQRTPAQHPAL